MDCLLQPLKHLFVSRYYVQFSILDQVEHITCSSFLSSFLSLIPSSLTYYNPTTVEGGELPHITQFWIRNY